MEPGFGLVMMFIYLLSQDFLLWLEKYTFSLKNNFKINKKKINWTLFSKEDMTHSTP